MASSSAFQPDMGEHKPLGKRSTVVPCLNHVCSNYPAQFKAFWDKTGGQWQTGAFWGKYAGVFVSTGTPGGGQESTVIAAMSTLTHHGIIYVPLGYKTVFGTLADLTEVRGGSPWGAGTFSVSLDIPNTCLRFCMGKMQKLT